MSLLRRLLGREPERRDDEDRAPAGAPPAHPAETTPIERYAPRDGRAEVLVAALLVLAGLLGTAFVVLYVVDDDTQLLGLAGGLGLAALAAALLVASLRVVVQETAVEPREPFGDREAEGEAAHQVRSGVQGVSRRGLLLGAAGVAGTGLGAAAVVPAASLGPRPHGELMPSPWRAGQPLVDEDDKPVRAADLTTKSFVTALPRGADKRELGSPVVVVRVDPRTLELPPERARWAPGGIVAYSKICTHAGCAVALYRVPKSEPTSDPPGLVCPCHYSTFDPRRAAKVVFGPAGRALPQLPLRVAPDGTLHAAGPLSGSVGPAWWGTERP